MVKGKVKKGTAKPGSKGHGVIRKKKVLRPKKRIA